MIKEVIASGKTVVEAQENARALLGAGPLDDVSFQIIHAGSKGIQAFAFCALASFEGAEADDLYLVAVCHSGCDRVEGCFNNCGSFFLGYACRFCNCGDEFGLVHENISF